MSQVSLKANGVEFQAGYHESERCTVHFGLTADLDEDGRLTNRPRAAISRVSRRMLKSDGKLSLLALVLSGQRFNLLAQQADKHPVAELLLDRQAGQEFVPLYKVIMKDVQPIRWTLSWIGGGNDGLSGADFVESVSMTCSEGKVVNLTDNSEASFKLD
ncbi:MAG: hypothetical protein IPN34_17625 [Planctomycetes bacterium]|nr:hypothetical protein [Planctomycetota bacterium]